VSMNGTAPGPQKQKQSKAAASAATPMPNQREAASLPSALVTEPRYAPVLEYLTGKAPTDRHLSMDVLSKYGVGASVYRFRNDEGEWKDEICITYPWLCRQHEMAQLSKNGKGKLSKQEQAGDEWTIARLKARSYLNKANQKLDPAGLTHILDLSLARCLTGDLSFIQVGCGDFLGGTQSQRQQRQS
jgi:hypothetical protein